MRRLAGLPARRTVLFAAGALAAALVALAAARLTGPLAALEVELSDRVRIAMAPAPAAQDPRLSIVAIDEASMAKLPYRSPVDRGFLASVIQALGAAGAAAIGLDILMDQPTEPEKDARLAAAIRAFDGPVVLAWADARSGMTQAQSDWLAAFIDRSGAIPGFANLVHDRDGIVRRHAGALPGTAVDSFAGALAGRPAPAQAGPRWVIDWRKPSDPSAPAFQTTPAHILPLIAANPAILQTWFAGRTVIVGADLPQQDRHVTPLSMVLGGPATAGAEIHAHLVSQILDDRFVPEMSAAPRALVVTALALLACLIALAPLSFATRLALLAACLGAYLAATVGLAALGVPVLPVVPAVAALVLAAGGTMGLDGLLAHRDRRFVRSAFSHYLAPELVDHLIANPSALRLGGERRRMTFLFTDIAGFTGMSERMEAEALGRLLNDYLDGVGEIVMRHRGVIDKYIGDAVVALFGVPAEDPAHAARAIRCAAEIDAFAERFRAAYADVGLGVTRIGVNTGEAAVGNFGGKARFDYTAIGDAMNIAARLEGSNKAFGTRIAISGDCIEAARPHFGDPPPLYQIGDVVLKGKAQPIALFTLDGTKTTHWLEAYSAAFAALDASPDRARERLARLAPDPVVSFHLDRIAQGIAGRRIELKEK